MPRKRFTAAAKRHYSLRANPVRAAVAAAAARAQAATAAAPPAAAAAAAAAAVAPVARPAPRGRRGRPRRQVAGVKNIEGVYVINDLKLNVFCHNLEILRLIKEVLLFVEWS